MPRDLTLHVRITRYEVGCRMCGWAASIRDLDDAADALDAHRQPVLLALHSRLNDGPVERWVCRKPKVLR